MKGTEAIRCILIDDHEEEHEIFSLGLKMSNLPVISHYYFFADEAFDILYNRLAPEPTVIFLDMNIPRMNGTEFLKKIKNTDFLKHIPIFVYSLSEDPEIRQHVMELGAVQYFTKPQSKTQLAQMLIKALEAYLPETE